MTKWKVARKIYNYSTYNLLNHVSTYHLQMKQLQYVNYFQAQQCLILQSNLYLPHM